jgi:hypothetical protein
MQKRSKLWITREKLWINSPNWGKLALLCEFCLILVPPHVGAIRRVSLNIFRPPVGSNMGVLFFSSPQAAWGEDFGDSILLVRACEPPPPYLYHSASQIVYPYLLRKLLIIN